jgi:hypothetical protein
MKRYTYVCKGCGLIIVGAEHSDGNIYAQDQSATQEGEPRDCLCWTCVDRIKEDVIDEMLP